MKLPTKTLEKNLFKSGYQYVIGVDEVGMGCLAGPVVVCAVAFKKKFFDRKYKKLRWLRDSKLLSSKQREAFALPLLLNTECLTRVAYCYSKTIDKLNIYNAARLAMKRAILNMGTMSKCMVPMLSAKSVILVDGKTKIKGLNIEQIPIVKGDRKVFAIACASIIAKVFRDRMMIRYAKKYPGYGFEKHKGYGTKYHQVQLTFLGPCSIHRKSFAPVAKLI